MAGGRSLFRFTTRQFHKPRLYERHCHFMKTSYLPLALLLSAGGLGAAEVSLFDGKTFAGWEGDTNKTWRIEHGAFVGGSLAAKVPRNEFMRTRRSYTN